MKLVQNKQEVAACSALHQQAVSTCAHAVISARCRYVYNCMYVHIEGAHLCDVMSIGQHYCNECDCRNTARTTILSSLLFPFAHVQNYHKQR